jgi:hypothetical protein
MVKRVLAVTEEEDGYGQYVFNILKLLINYQIA